MKPTILLLFLCLSFNAFGQNSSGKIVVERLYSAALENPGGENPRYEVSYSEERPPLICFSKVYDDPENPQEEFAAVMTCTDAEQNCPFVPGTEKRISLPYIDPKEADDTPKEKERYDERSLQIASEMFYVFGKVAG